MSANKIFKFLLIAFGQIVLFIVSWELLVASCVWLGRQQRFDIQFGIMIQWGFVLFSLAVLLGDLVVLLFPKKYLFWVVGFVFFVLWFRWVFPSTYAHPIKGWLYLIFGLMNFFVGLFCVKKVQLR